MFFSPLEQFTIFPIKYLFKFFESFGFLVNSYIFFLLTTTAFLSIVIIFGLLRPKIVPTGLQFVLEELYDFVYQLVVDTLGVKNARFFPYIFFIFLSILSFNLFGLLPYGFTLTAQVVTVSFFSFSTFIGIIVIGVVKHKLNSLGLFFPPGAPVGLAWLLVPIELVSFFSRPFSLAIRLFANLTAGHVLLKILSGFVIYAFFSIISGLWLPIFHYLSLKGGYAGFQFSIGDSILVTYSKLFQQDLVETYNSFSARHFVETFIYEFMQGFSFLPRSVNLQEQDFQNILSLFRTQSNHAVLWQFSLVISEPSSSSLSTEMNEEWFKKLVSRFSDLEDCMFCFKKHRFAINYLWLAQFFSPDVFDVNFFVFNEICVMNEKWFKKLVSHFSDLENCMFCFKKHRFAINYLWPAQFFSPDVFNVNFFVFNEFCVKEISSLMISSLFCFDLSIFLTIFFKLLLLAVLAGLSLLFIAVLFVFIVLEVFVAVLQAYVFSILSTIYIRDVLELH
jgi:F-type H+-transporting ATPase subunit a